MKVYLKLIIFNGCPEVQFITFIGSAHHTIEVEHFKDHLNHNFGFQLFPKVYLG